MKQPRPLWQRLGDRPFLAPISGTLAPNAVTTPDILDVRGQTVLFLGAVMGQTERLIRVPMGTGRAGGPGVPALEAASIVLEPGPHEFDCQHVFDPAAIVIGDQIHLFYSAIGNGPDRIGQAICTDGQSFVKVEHVVCTGRSPEVVSRAGRLYLFYVLRNAQAGYRIHVSVQNAAGGVDRILDSPALSAGAPGSWDAYEVTTPRIIQRDSVYYMMYAGGGRAELADKPAGFGLARSSDLIHWEKYPANPVFCCGAPGAWDDGALWFGTVFEQGQALYLLYEAGRLADLAGPGPGLTQVGLAGIDCATFDRAMRDW